MHTTIDLPLRKWGSIAFLTAAILLTTGIAFGQELTEEPPPPTETPTATEQLPTEVPSETPTLEPTPEATETLPPPTETLAPEITPEITASPEVTAEPSLTPTATTLPAEPTLTLLLNDTFDASSPHWQPQPGVSTVGQTLEIAPEATAVLAYEPFTNVAVQANFLLNENGIARLTLRESEAGGYTALIAANGRVDLYRAGVLVKAAAVEPPQPGQWRTLRLSVMGGVLRVAVDGTEIIAELDATPLPAGGITLQSSGNALLADDFQLWGAPGEVLPSASPPLATANSTQLLIPQIEAAVVAANGVQILPEDISFVESWALARILINTNDTADHDGSAELILVLAYWDGQNWQIAVEGTAEFYQWVPRTPDTLISPVAKTSLTRQNAITASSVATDTGLGLPIPIGEWGTLTGGTHSNNGCYYDPTYGFLNSDCLPHLYRPWSSIDFVPDSSRIAAAGSGVAWTASCAVRIDHQNGWHSGYHHAAAIPGNINGQWIPLNTIIGEISTCGMTTGGAHVHYTVRYGSATNYVELHQHAIGGWQPEDGAYQYQGCLLRLSDGARICANNFSNRRLYNDGTLGSGIPTAPSNLSATSASMTQINLSWVDNSGNESGFAIERSIDGVNWQSLGSVSANATTHADVGLACGTSYSYRVRAAGNGGTFSSYTNTASATTSPCIKPTTAPILVSLPNNSYTNNSAPNLSWNPVNNPSVVYEVQIDTTNTFAAPLSFTQTTGGTTVAVAPALANGRYFWRVRARNAAGTGLWSLIWNFTVDTLPPAVPTLIAPVNGLTTTVSKPTMSWGAVTGANLYRVQLSTDPNFNNPLTFERTTTSYIPVNSLSQGLYYWRAAARDQAGNWSAYSTARSYTINIQIAPANEYNYVTATTARPNFTWAAVPGATGYTVEVALDSDFGTIIYTSPTSLATSHLLPVANALGHSTYYWRVLVTNFPNVSPVYRQFTVTPTLPIAPVLSSPANGNYTNTNPPLFTWNPVVYAYGNVTYNVEIAPTNTFVNPVFTAFNMPITSLGLNNPLADGLYCWRVRSVNQYGAKGAWSRPNCFTIDTTPPPAPALVAPANGTTITTSRPTLSWSAVTGANLYRVQVSSNPSFTNPQTYEPATTSQALTTSLGQGVWYWRAAARDRAGNWGAYSAARTFTLNIQLGPADGARLVTATTIRPTFTWAAVTGATGYTLQIARNSTFTQMVYTSPTLLTTSHPLPAANALGHGQYYWRVVVGGFPHVSPVYRQFTVTPAAPPAPILNTPTNGATVNNPNPQLKWLAVTYPYGAVTYKLEVATSATFAANTLVYSTQGLTGTSHVVTTALSNRLYYWRVKAVNFVGVEGAWSAYRSMGINFVQPVAPVLLTPTNGSTTNDNTPYLQWSGVAYPTALTFQVQVDDNSNFSSPVVSQGGLGTNYTTGTLPDGLYYWRVRAINSDGASGLWSATWNFRVQTATLTYRGRLFWQRTMAGCVSPSAHDQWNFEIWLGATNVWFEVSITSGNLQLNLAPYHGTYQALPAGQGYNITVAPQNGTSGCYALTIRGSQEDTIPVDARLYWNQPVYVCTAPNDYNAFYFETWNVGRNIWFDVSVASGNPALPTHLYNKWYAPRPQNSGYHVVLWPTNGVSGCYYLTIRSDNPT